MLILTGLKHVSITAVTSEGFGGVLTGIQDANGVLPGLFGIIFIAALWRALDFVDVLS